MDFQLGWIDWSSLTAFLGSVWAFLYVTFAWILKVIINIVVYLGILVLAVFFIVRLRGKKGIKKQKKSIEMTDLGRQLESYSLQVKKATTNKKVFKKMQVISEQKRKHASKIRAHGPITFVVDFDGDIKASQVDIFRDEVSAILQSADPKKDEVVVRVESRGGAVHGYGLAASQLQRIRDRKIPLTICIDKVAASGGYMMACVANKILAAPFAIVGSIGVISMFPNFNRLLKNKDIDYQEFTAGEFKRTVTMFGEVTQKGKDKLLSDLQDIHELFKSHVKEHRPSLDLSKIATGEYWYGIRAKELNLIDEIMTSDDYIYKLLENNRKVFKVKLSVPKNFVDKLGSKFQSLISNPLTKQAPEPPEQFLQY